MKKFFAILTMVAIISCIFAGCTNEETFLGSTTEPQPQKNLERFYIEESDLFDLYLKLYEEKKNDEKFISDREIYEFVNKGFNVVNYEEGLMTFYDNIYNEIRKYYYPILLTDPSKEESVIGYVNEHGSLCVYNITQSYTDYYRNVHVPEGTEYIDYQTNYTVVYAGDIVELWEFGKKTAEVKVPNGSVYTGFSNWEGYLFRNGGDVYSVQLKEQSDGSPVLHCEPIAHRVKEVISTDYKLNSDAWSQPLFLMQDGSIKAYCSWHGDREAPRDDACHLAAPQYEGGYK